MFHFPFLPASHAAPTVGRHLEGRLALLEAAAFSEDMMAIFAPPVWLSATSV